MRPSILCLALLALACEPSMTARPLPDADGGPNAREPAPPATPTPTPRAMQACPADAARRVAQLRTTLEGLMTARSAPGGALVIVCGGSTAFVEPIGVRRRGDEAEVTQDTRFQLASSTKMLTGVLALALAREGLVDLDAPVSTYLPGAAYSDATLTQLLSHTAGLWTEFDAFDPDLGTVVEQNLAAPPWAGPGEVWNYSNPGFAVAGHALSVAAGRPFDALMRDYVLAPAGLDATLDVGVVMAGDYASGHGDEAPYEGVIEPDGAYFHTTYYGPMGGAWGSARDLARWITAHVGQAPGAFDEAVIGRTHTPVSRTTAFGQGYAFGHFIETSLSPRLVHHGGGAPGYATEVQMVPDAGFGVAVLANSDTFDASELVYEALEQFVTLEQTDAPPAVDPALYLGRYADPQVFGDVEIVDGAAGLRVRFLSRRQEAALEPIWGDSFRTTYDGETIDVHLWREGAEPATHLVSLWGVAARAL